MGFLPVFSFEPDWFHHPGCLCFQVALLVSLWVRCLHWMLQLLRPQEHTTRLMLVRNDANITMVTRLGMLAVSRMFLFNFGHAKVFFFVKAVYAV